MTFWIPAAAFVWSSILVAGVVIDRLDARAWKRRGRKDENETVH